MSRFRKGQQIVCVDDSAPMEDCSMAVPCRPRKGEVYTVRGIHREPHIEGYGVYVEELLNPPVIWSDGHEVEWPFASTRFRPLDKNKTSQDAEAGAEVS